jgi:RND family efflux transporter MFP subunit|nr:efflux RND transporter periplasmic adaptor subunit [Parasphingorhabdus flavimaris]|tara:strand:+ start:6638 stop:7729 length:1092 start_codon:yes stop_codon:yes gene_type:complete
MSFLVSCSGGETTTETAPLVRAFNVTGANGDTAGNVLTGTVAARVESVLSFREGGRIIERRVENGERVKSGQLIARIDAADLSATMQASQSQATAASRSVDAARATAQRAAADEIRLRGLAEAGAIAQRDYDAAVEGNLAAQARLRAAQADASAARSNARLQGNRRGYANLYAPASGIITDVLADRGQVVAAGSPVVRFAQSGPREVIVDIPEQNRDKLPANATGSLYGGGEFSVALRELSAAADPATRTYQARYRIIDAQPSLGATVTLQFSGTSNEKVHNVPISAVAERDDSPGVWIIKKDGKVVWRKVSITFLDGENAAVSGLRKGERIVSMGAHLLQSGQAVRVAAKPRRKTTDKVAAR